MTETKTIPAIARTAIALADADFQKVVNKLATQTLEAMGLSGNDGWSVDFNAGVAVRNVPETQTQSEPPPTTETQ